MLHCGPQNSTFKGHSPAEVETRASVQLTFDLYKVGGYEERNKGTAALAVHGHAEGHALAHDDCAMHQNDCQGNQRV